MNPLTAIRRFLAVAALFAAAALPATAQAKGVVLFNTGSELFVVADLPEGVKKDFPEAGKYKLGYKCKHFGIFWADVWTWNCEQVAVNGDLSGYADLPQQVKALTADRYSMSDAKRGFWNKYAFWTVIGVLVGGFVLLLVLGGKAEDDGEAPARA